jgi:5-methylthioadenosine/S-adenosylhomocysteine deaminase
MFDLLIAGGHAVDIVAGRAVSLGARDVAIEGGRIAAVEPAGTIDVGRSREHLEASGLAMLPGLVNAHAHAAMTLYRGAAEDVPFMDWFSDFIRPLEANHTVEDIYWGTLLAIAEMFEAGVTTFADHYFFLDAVAEAVRDSGARANLVECLYGDAAQAAPGLEATRRHVARWDGAAQGRIAVWIGPHSHYACSEDLLRACAALAQELGRGIHLHLAEEDWEVEQCHREHGVGPVELLRRCGILDCPTLCAHAIVIDDEEMRLLGAHGARVATCPRTYLRLGTGNTPVLRLLAAGVIVGIGSDGVASNATLDLWEQQRLANELQKFEARDATVATPAEALAWATQGGAAALGWEASIGRLAPAYLADLALVELRRPHLTPAPEIVPALAGQVRPSDVRHLFVQGRQVLRDGRLLTVDRERAMDEVTARAERLRAARAAR